MSSATKAVRMLRAGQTDAELMKRILKGLQSKPGRTETAKRFGGGVKFVGPSFCTPKYKTGNGMTRLVQGVSVHIYCGRPCLCLRDWLALFEKMLKPRSNVNRNVGFRRFSAANIISLEIYKIQKSTSHEAFDRTEFYQFPFKTGCCEVRS